jgi:hypothetical protein
MAAAPPPPNETARYSALMGYHLRQNLLWDAEANALWQRAVAIFDVPPAAIALVGADTAYFLSERGVGFIRCRGACRFAATRSTAATR